MRIRTAKPDDAAQIAAIYAPIVTDTAISFELEPPSVDEMRRRIEATLPVLPWLVGVDEDVGADGDAQGRICGYVYASKFRERAAYQWTVEVTAYVRSDCRGTGVGRRLYTRLFEVLAGLGYFQAVAGITLPNDASVGLHEALGFVAATCYRNVGHKQGAWRDVGYWQMALQPLQTHPLAPRAFKGRA